MENENPYQFLGGAPEQSASASVGILVYIEPDKSTLSEESFVAIGKCRELGDMLGTSVGAISVDPQIEKCAEEAFHAGADKLFLPEKTDIEKYERERYCDFITHVIKQIEPEVLIAPASPQIVDFLPRVAQQLKTGLISGCIAIDIDTTDRVVLVTRPAYGGKMHEIYTCATARPQMIMLMPASFSLPIMDDYRSGSIEKIVLS